MPWNRENPSIDDKKYVIPTTTTSSSGYFMCRLGGLEPKRTYDVRSYAINTRGLSYGNDISFTMPALPEFSTDTVIEVANWSAIVAGNLTSMGVATESVEIGICYGTEKDPEKAGNYAASSATGTGKFTCDLTNLTPGMQYFFKAYIAWERDPDWGWFITYVYGNEGTFTTPKLGK